jgi:hypothetical protein
MAGSGLEDIFELNYGRDTVVHMLSGKAVSRAIRGHFLVDGALMEKLIQSTLSPSDQEREATLHGYQGNLTPDDVSDLRAVCESVCREKLCVNECSILENASLLKLDECLEKLKASLSADSRTARLWLQYMHYIDTVKRFILAERTTDWHLHLEAVNDMLNLFAATGHSNYCARLYLQMMRDLPDSHPWLYSMFQKHGFHSIRRSDRFWAGLSTDLVIEQTMMKTIKGRGGLTRGRGFDENVRSVWVHTLHQCAGVHLAMTSMTGLHSSTQQHVDVGKSRANRDCRDMQKVLDWLDCNDPFVVGDGKLHSLSSGLMAGDDSITCDDAETVGSAIHQKMDDICFTDVVMKKSNQVRTLSHLQKLPPGAKKALAIHDTSLFHRLVILAERSGNIPSYFAFDLTAVSASLFKDGLMRKADKPVLAKALTSGLSFKAMSESVTYVVDGGCLLHKVRWSKNTTYYDVVQQYIMFVNKHYGKSAVVIFDGYLTEPTTKDHEHKRRLSKAVKVAPDVCFDESVPVIFDQSSFLANEVNKNRFIKMLMVYLDADGFTFLQAQGDADTDIVSAALQFASSGQGAVAVAAEDTDLLVLLVHHLAPNMADIYFMSHAKKKSSSAEPISVRAVQQKLGRSACEQLLVVHALGGCYTTSAVYSHGKGKIFQKITTSRFTKDLTDVILQTQATQDEVVHAGLQLMVLLYGGKRDEALNKMRYTTYSKMTAMSLLRPQPERLPPTERSASFHIMRVHLQAIHCKTLALNDLDPLKWGWQVLNGTFVPIMTDLPAAPEDVLNIVRCKCKTGCTSSLCSCRKNGLSCVAACGHCHGDSCSNAEPLTHCNNDSSDTEAEADFLETETATEESNQLCEFIFDTDMDWISEEVVESMDTCTSSAADMNMCSTACFMSE